MVGFDAKKVSTRLKEARKKKGLNQEQLAKAADISLSGLQNYEATNSSRSENNKRMGAETLSRLAQLLDVSSDYLLGLTDDSAKHPIAVDDLGLSGEAVAELKRIKSSSHSEEERAFLGLLSKIIVDCSPVALREAYINYCAFREMYEKREDMRKQDISVLCRQAGLTVGDIVSPESLGYSFDNYVDYIYSQMKRYEFEILLHVSAALSR